MQNENCFERIFFYWRQSMYGHIHVLCDTFLKSKGADPIFYIWDALASSAEGKTSAGLATLQRISNRVAMGLPVAAAQMCVHKKALQQDIASISELELQIEKLKKSASSEAVVQAAQVFWLSGDENTALNLVHPLTTQSPANKSAAALYGWIKLASFDRNSGRWFDMANSETGSTKGLDPFVLYGKAMYFANLNRFQESIQLLVQVSGLKDIPESLCERARIYISMNNWDLALEAASEANGRCVSDADFYFISALYCLTQSGNLESARNHIKELANIIYKFEKDSAEYIVRVSRLLLDLSWKDQQVAKSLYPLFENISKTRENNSSVMSIYGDILLVLGKNAEAQDVFQNALVFSSDSIHLLYGLIVSQLSQGKINEAQDQMAFFEVMVSNPEQSMYLSTLKSHISYLLTHTLEVDPIIKSMKSHLDGISQSWNAPPIAVENEIRLPVDRYIEQYTSLNLGIFSDALKEVLNSCNTLEYTVVDPKNGIVCDVIAKMLDFNPGSVPISYFLAILAFGEGRYSQAMKAIQFVLNSRWGYNPSLCHLLLAQIRLQMKQYDESEASLNRAVSYDFSIRSTFRYNMIMAQLTDCQGAYELAIRAINDISSTSDYSKTSTSEKVDVLIFKSKVLNRMDKNDESLLVVNEALSNYTGTPHETTIKLYKAKLLASIGKTQEGLAILESFAPTNPSFSRARRIAAKIYLNDLRDKSAYIRCFKQLVTSSPNKSNFVMLGDALMKVKRYSEAVDAFKSAFESDQTDEEVALHLARSYMIVHDFKSALLAYQNALNVSNNNNRTLLEYCQALVKLHNFDEAKESALMATQSIDVENSDWESQYVYAEFYELLSIIYSKTGVDSAQEAITEALSTYDKLTVQNRIDIPADAKKDIQDKAAALYLKSAENAQDDYDSAIENLNKAIDLQPNLTGALLSLANAYYAKNDKDKCLVTCQQLLRIDSQCEEAAILMAEVSGNANIDDLETAFFASPHFYRTLYRLIEMCARGGLLEKVPLYLQKAKPDNPGYLFCNGLYHIYIGDPQEAIKQFYKCRNDPEYGIQSQQMVFSIYVNPSRKYVWNDDKPLATQKDLESAQKILNRLDPEDIDIEQFQQMLLLSQNTIESVSKALEYYEKGDPQDLESAIGRCKCYLRLGKQTEATRNLNSIIHGTPNHKNYSIFVEAFLMMTDISIKQDSYDEAEKYVQNALDLDQSCVKGHEFKSYIMEKKTMFNDAAESLMKAWKLTNESDLLVGYKLSLNLMKAKRFVEAVKVSRMILAKHPNYPKLKDSVFLPCIAELRK